jgi:hypothetical protein
MRDGGLERFVRSHVFKETWDTRPRSTHPVPWVDLAVLNAARISALAIMHSPTFAPQLVRIASNRFTGAHKCKIPVALSPELC